MAHPWKDLIVWQKAHELVLGIYKLTINFPDNDIYPSESASIATNASIASNAFTASKAFSSPFPKVLIITYYWPPSGGAGVQRWLKFSKYLPQYGWEPIILTVDPDCAAYPVTDESLEVEVPHDLKVFTTPAIDYFSIYKKDKSRIPSAGFANNIDNTFKGKLLRFIRGNFFIPDPRRGWNGYAFRKACGLIESENIKHVITTSPPHSTQLIGLRLKKKYPGIKWVADLRDPWTDIYYYSQFYPTFIPKAIDRWYERRVLRNSDFVLTVGKSLKDLFASKEKEAAGKTEIITNGYDPEDFKDIISSDPEIFTISYIGTLSDTYPVKGFLLALRKFSESGENFSLRFLGTVSGNQKDQILSHAECSDALFYSYADHDEALKFMAATSVLLLIIPDHSSNRSIITGKIFEYIASGKTIICIGPLEGDAAEIIRESGCGKAFGYNDSDGIFEYLKSIGKERFPVRSKSTGKYSREELTGKVSRLLEKI
jgi:glycosyltransferase involved in cell wall biosynthesis